MSKRDQIKAVRGMNDILPEESAVWQLVEAHCQQVFSNFNYSLIRTPVLESTNLFARSMGADTDIVSKEMYTFEDRNGDSLTLRPEGTASCVRAGIENGLFYNQQQRLWYLEPMFRHERPQKGRYRQFYQIGAEAYGWDGPDIEAEMLSMVQQLFNRLGLVKTHLEINSLGDSDSRKRYLTALLEYLSAVEDQLDEDSQRRLTTNPLRILDSKNAKVQELLVEAPSILDFLSTESSEKFEVVQSYLQALNIEFSVNPKLVRGLDYYNDLVFEWINEDFGAQSTVCAGGRYDGLVEQLGGQATPGFGFAIGQERLVQILIEQGANVSQVTNTPQIYIISSGDTAREQALVLQQNLSHHDVKTQCHMGSGSIKNQFKRADKSGADLALIIGEEEAVAKELSIKVLREHKNHENGQLEQQRIAQNDALNVVTNLLESL